LIRLFAGITQNEIENEVRAVTKLCKSGHPNIVQVFQIGQLTHDTAFYFIDMELCDFTLGSYIHCASTPHLVDWKRLRQQGASSALRMEIKNIAGQITDGLLFIHDLGEAHRDLTPQNGKVPLWI
jgi:serine/threonine protein kinase